MRLLASALLAALFFLPAFAGAQSPDRVFLRIVDEAGEVTSLETGAPHFRARVLESGAVEFAGTTEMEATFAECRQQIGVSATQERECRLQAARRLFVEHVLELRMLKGSPPSFALSVWDPDANTLIFEAIAKGQGTSVETSAALALPALADRYLCFRGVQASCDATPAVASATPAPTPAPDHVSVPLSESDATVMDLVHTAIPFGDIQLLRTYRTAGLRGISLVVPDGTNVGTSGEAIVALGGPGFEIAIEPTDGSLDATEDEVTVSMHEAAAELQGFAWESRGVRSMTLAGRRAMAGTFSFLSDGGPLVRTIALVEVGSDLMVVSCNTTGPKGDRLHDLCPKVVSSLEFFSLWENHDPEAGFAVATPGHWYNDPETRADLAKHAAGEAWSRDTVEVSLLPAMGAGDPAAALGGLVTLEDGDSWVTDGMLRERVAGRDSYVGVVERDAGLGKLRLMHVIVPAPNAALRVSCRFEADRTEVMVPACLHMANSAQIDPEAAPKSQVTGVTCARCAVTRTPPGGHRTLGLWVFGLIGLLALRRRPLARLDRRHRHDHLSSDLDARRPPENEDER